MGLTEGEVRTFTERLNVDEIIAHCDRQLRRVPVNSVFYLEHEAVKAYLVELKELRAQQEREKIEPLTLEELREMGGEPVFIQNLQGKPEGEWKVVRHISETAVSFTDKTSRYIPDSSSAVPCYGRTWLAYRRKPEEGAT